MFHCLILTIRVKEGKTEKKKTEGIGSIFEFVSNSHNCIPRTNVRTGDTMGLVVVTPRPPPRPPPRLQTFHRSHDNLINYYWIASIFYM